MLYSAEWKGIGKDLEVGGRGLIGVWSSISVEGVSKTIPWIV
jgi:hypothetical protein